MKPQSLLLALLLWPALLQAQHAFEKDIQAFEATDRQTPPTAQPIVFTGSSSIVYWKTLNADYADKPILRRGFGGSTLKDVRYFADRVILAYKPKQLVLYAGENDIAGGVSAKDTYRRFTDLFRYVRQHLPGTRFSFISIKPSPSRRKFFGEMEKANRRIKRFLSHKKNTDFIDIRPVMLQPDGRPDGRIFRPDSLHMNESGYQRWVPVVRPYLN